MNTLGKQSKTTFLNTESHKLFLGFTVGTGVTVYPGQPLKLNDDGTVAIFTKTDALSKLIGYAYNSGTAGEEITAITTGFAVVWALSAAAQNAGPVAISSYDNTTDVGDSRIGYSVYEAAGANTAHGIALDAAAAGAALIRVLLKG